MKKNAVDKIINYIKDPDYRFLVNAKKSHYFPVMDDSMYLKRLYKAKMGKELDLTDPKSFNEKLQWLKLYNRNPSYTKMVDKFEMKHYASEIIGEEYLIPTYGVWEKFDDIDIKTLPEQFVLKCTHDSGGLVICNDIHKFDRQLAKIKIEKSLNRNFYLTGREWPYKNVKPRIIAEKYLSNNDGQLTDYKVHCFNGIPKIILVCKNRFSNDGMTENFYTENWRPIEVHRPGVKKGKIEKPLNLDEMLELSKKLSVGIPFLRCDYYDVNNKLYLGELTFFPSSGLKPFVPESYDYEFGAWLDISQL